VKQRRTVAWLAMCAALGACRSEPETTGAAAPVILISIDTLRSDHLPVYGYREVSTPAIDSLRRDGLLFERAYAHVPLTLPSHAAVFSGTLPTHNGVRDNLGYSVDSSTTYLPCLLREHGYATGAAVSSFVLRRETGIAGCFDFFDDEIRTRSGRGLGGLQRPGAETLSQALAWLRRQSGDRFLLWLHVYEPHAPYDPPEPFASRYASAYDGEIAAADAVVGELLAELHRSGIYDRALIVLFSDHGEGLGEHGEEGHGALLYRHDLQVPLMLKLPRAARAGAAERRPVGLIDVAPTILEVLGLSAPAAMDGGSLLRQESRPVYSETWAPRLHYGWSELTSWIDGSDHLIEGPDPELYDLVADPAETTNKRLTERRRFAAMSASLAREVVPLQAPRAVDEETRRSLTALGYVGQAALDESENLPDPKTMLGTLATLERGMELFAKEETQEAVVALREAAAENPRMVDAWDYLGRSYQKLGQPERALAAYRRVLQLVGAHPEAALGTARALVEVNRPKEALALIRDQAARAPSDLRLRLLEARLLLLLGEPAAAREVSQRILHETPENADAWYGIGSVEMTEGHLQAAESAFRRALAIQADHPAALNDLGVLLAAQHRDGEALSLLEALVELQPTNEPARRSLAMLRARHGSGGG
jgi:cytochrome c-type biogenesis protein CcmH/NrfG